VSGCAQKQPSAEKILAILSPFSNLVQTPIKHPGRMAVEQPFARADGVTPGHAVMKQPVEDEFCSLFCAQFHCPPQKFEKQVFVECVYPHAGKLARFIGLIRPGVFKADFALIEQIKHATSLEEVRRVVRFHGAQDAPGGLIRLVLKVRVSRQRLLHLAKELFSGER
jgi:hypothetical protein